VVHRDIKPENVLLQAGQALVADFGIALALSNEESTRLTAAGLSIGTPTYMSPEQASGEYDIDARSDAYALVTKVLTETPPPVREKRPEVAVETSAAIARAMEKRPSDRQASVAELVTELGAMTPAAGVPSAASGAGFTQAAGFSTRTKVVAAAVVIALVVLGGTAIYRWRVRNQEREWARLEAIPEVRRLLGESETIEAFNLALRAQEVLPDDPTLAGLLDAASGEVDIDSNPPGALVSYRPYARGDWVTLGTTPLRQVRLPDRELVVRFERDGSPVHERGFLPAFGISLTVRLEDSSEASEASDANGARDASGASDAVWIPAGAFVLGAEPMSLAEFRIDQSELTNAEFQRFIDAGSYDDPAAWTTTFAAHGISVDGERAAAEFRDTTGRPGPAAWELSRHAAGRADHPVRGVSWFEAAAFCEWAGKSLPTFYHWKHAAGVSPRDNMLAASNMAGTSVADGPVAVGSTESFGINGTVDIAGNVREWVWNESRLGRYVLGGAWDSPTYVFTGYEAADPWDRGLTNGFRCVRYLEPPGPETFSAPSRSRTSTSANWSRWTTRRSPHTRASTSTIPSTWIHNVLSSKQPTIGPASASRSPPPTRKSA